MSLFVLVHGAWHGPWCWDLLTPELAQRGHSAVTVDLPWSSPEAGYESCIDAVLQAIDSAGQRPADNTAAGDVVVVGHFLGGILLPPVAARRAVRRLVFLSGLVPRPGRRLDDVLAMEPHTFQPDWSTLPRIVHDDGAVSWDADPAIDAFYHDCDPTLARWAAGKLRRQAWTIWDQPCPMATWPDTGYSLVYGTDDRVLAPRWSVDVAEAVLEVAPVALPGGHAPMLARPAALADLLVDLASGADDTTDDSGARDRHRASTATSRPSSSSTAPSSSATRPSSATG